MLYTTLFVNYNFVCQKILCMSIISCVSIIRQ